MQIILEILNILLQVLQWIIIIQIVFSWLVAFNVINMRNELLNNIYKSLRRMTEPLYRPIRKILPDFGMIDISPMIVLLGIIVMQSVIIPRLYIAFSGA